MNDMATAMKCMRCGKGTVRNILDYLQDRTMGLQIICRDCTAATVEKRSLLTAGKCRCGAVLPAHYSKRVGVRGMHTPLCPRCIATVKASRVANNESTDNERAWRGQEVVGGAR